MTDQLPDDSPSRFPPEHPTDPPDEEEIEAAKEPLAKVGDFSGHLRLSSPRGARRLPT